MAVAGQWTYSKSYYDPESGPNLDGFELAGVQGHSKNHIAGDRPEE